MPSIAAGVDFDTVAREWRCKWSDEDCKASLKACQKLLEDLTIDILQVTHDFVGKQLKTTEVLNGKLDVGKQTVQRIVCNECNDFKVVVKLPLEMFAEWEKRNFAPEATFLEGLRAIPGVSQVETQTYTLEVVNLMGKVQVPKAANGCMAASLPRAA
mmetsp:Transcript_32495/g.52285  ORF Transcript_32495/g.52285 Transcript_32495/m.52285 type:complete len:157 (+) Transcript_32495:63-533(+)